jgi:two-component system KDP operon response regulator KdpE
MTHRTLLGRVWGREYLEETNYLKVHVKHLRQKLEDDPSDPRYILTEPTVGYKFARGE